MFNMGFPYHIKYSSAIAKSTLHMVYIGLKINLLNWYKFQIIAQKKSRTTGVLLGINKTQINKQVLGNQ
jgi:hypothetical protein